MKRIKTILLILILGNINLNATMFPWVYDKFAILEFDGYQSYSKIIKEDLQKETDLEEINKIIKKIRIKYAEDIKAQFQKFDSGLQSLSPREEDWVKSELKKIETISNIQDQYKRKYDLKRTDEYIKYYLKNEIDKKIYILNGIINADNDFKEMYQWTQLANTYYDIRKNNDSFIICEAKKRGIGFVIQNDLKCNDDIFNDTRILGPYLNKTRSIYKDLLESFLMYHWQSKYGGR